MSLKTLDRVQWSYARALTHVKTVTVARRSAEAAKLPPAPKPPMGDFNPFQQHEVVWEEEVKNDLLVALRDGDLLAHGRYTHELLHSWQHSIKSSDFNLHSGHHSSIRPEQWREGKLENECLTGRDWQFIDIRMPRFLVKAIWPDYIAETVRPAQRVRCDLHHALSRSDAGGDCGIPDFTG